MRWDVKWIYSPKSNKQKLGGKHQAGKAKPASKSGNATKTMSSKHKRSKSASRTQSSAVPNIQRPKSSLTKSRSVPFQTTRGRWTKQHSDDIDLEYTMDAIQRNLEYFHSLRKNREEFVNDVTEKSDDLKQYSRDQFEYSLNNNPKKVIQCYRHSSLQDIYNGKTNGPSKSGSPLHSSRARIMNSIRTRPHTEPRYNTHDRSSRYPKITETINNSNAEYTVIRTIPIPGHTRPDVILIPTAADTHNEKEQFYDPAILDLDRMNLTQDGTRPNTHHTGRSGLTSRQSVPRIMLQTGSPIPDSPPPSPEPPKDSKGKSASKKAADLNSKMNKAKKKPKCWVDTATVSDIIDENSKKRNNQNMKNLKKKKKVEEETLIVTLDDIQDEELPLPDYICPSSEDKSKEAAIRNWLRETTFTKANKTLPLL